MMSLTMQPLRWSRFVSQQHFTWFRVQCKKNNVEACLSPLLIKKKKKGKNLLFSGEIANKLGIDLL